jgi:OOP family OmpA-OmpF porin
MGKELDRIKLLEQRLDRPALHALETSHVLPQAIVQCAAKDSQLAEALALTVRDSIKLSVQREPQDFADALFPIMGPAIRKSIAAALASLVEATNQALEHSLTPRGLWWRLEALRTGVSFGEVVMRKSIAFRVEQVMLIHRESGLLLAHVIQDGVVVADADMVSGMLTAIQSFIHDSFSVDAGDKLQTMRVGDLNVWVEQGAEAYLAAVIRGSAPASLNELLQQNLEGIHAEQGRELADFHGETGPFVACEPRLRACLHTQVLAKEETSSALLWGLLLIMGSLGCGWLLFDLRDSWRWRRYAEALSAQPGFCVTSASRKGGGYQIAGLRDPLARDPASLLKGSKILPDKVESHWEPYLSLHPDLVAERVMKQLHAPTTVSLRWDSGRLMAAGSASHAWIERLRIVAASSPGVTGLDDTQLVDADENTPEAILARARARLQPPSGVSLQFSDGVLTATGKAEHSWVVPSRALAAQIPGIQRYVDKDVIDQDVKAFDVVSERIERHAIYYELGTAQANSPQMEADLSRIAESISSLLDLAGGLQQSVRIMIVGHTDSSGNEEQNLQISLGRAEAIRAMLIQKAVPAAILSCVGVGSREPARKESTPQDREFNRRVTFRVLKTDAQ